MGSACEVFLSFCGARRLPQLGSSVRLSGTTRKPRIPGGNVLILVTSLDVTFAWLVRMFFGNGMKGNVLLSTSLMGGGRVDGSASARVERE